MSQFNRDVQTKAVWITNIFNWNFKCVLCCVYVEYTKYNTSTYNLVKVCVPYDNAVAVLKLNTETR